ncbi:putative leader peptide [Jatrophihabitans sp. YIM 134969]
MSTAAPLLLTQRRAVDLARIASALCRAV